MARTESPSLVELAEIVASRTKTINDFLKTNSLPQPSFDVNGPFPDYLPYDNREILTARRELVQASRLISELAGGAKNQFFERTTFGVCLDCSSQPPARF
jgi:hypothetical protein